MLQRSGYERYDNNAKAVSKHTIFYCLNVDMLTLNDFVIGHRTRSVRLFLTVELLYWLLSQFCAVNTECSFYHLLEQSSHIDSLHPPGHHVKDVDL